MSEAAPWRPVAVSCYAGYRGEETPRSLQADDQTRRVCRIYRRWLSPGHRYFEVETEDGVSVLLRHDPSRDVWELAVRASRWSPA